MGPKKRGTAAEAPAACRPFTHGGTHGREIPERRPPTERIRVCGVGFDPVTKEQAAAVIAAAAHGGPGLRVYTPNPLIVMRARRDPAFAAVLAAADLSLPDGTGIVSAASRAGTPLPGRTPGIETAEAALELLSRRGGSFYLLGGAPGLAPEAADALCRRFPGLRCSGTRDGYFPEEQTQEILREMRSASPDLLCVCLGSPKQELWIDRYASRTGAAALMGLGGAVDVWSGRMRRASALFLRLRLEWLWRMLREPRRFAALPDLVRFRILTRKKADKR